MLPTERFAMLTPVRRLPFGPVPALTPPSSFRLLRGNGTRLAVLSAVLALLALFGATRQAGAQTTFTCSTATPSANCALSVPGGDETLSPPPAYAAANSSTLTVSGATGPVASVKVVLLGVTSSNAKYVNTPTNQNTYESISWSSFLLEDPAGDQLDLLGGTGTGTDPMSGTDITIEDGATVAPPTTSNTVQTSWPATGSVTVEPSQYYVFFSGVPIYDSTPADWPQPDGSATLASKFSGAAANGTWTLHLASSDILINYPDWVSDPVSITGWELILTYSTLAESATTVSSNLNPSYTSGADSSVTLTATVNGSAGTPTGTVAFSANGATISGCGAQALSGGTATCTTTFAAEGKYSIVAAYSGSSSYAGSSSSGATLYQLVINHTTNPSGSQYCNTGNLTTTGATIQDLIYPSYIQVPDTVTQSVANVSVLLNGLQSTTSNGLSGAVSTTSFLLVSPGETNNLDFLSHVETGSPQPSVDVTIADGNPLVPNGEGTNGGTCENGTGPYCVLQNDTTYGPTDDSLESDSFVTPSGSLAPPSALNYPLPYGGSSAETFEQAFGGATAAGNWLLYIENDSGEPLSLSGGWCIDLTLNTGSPTTTTVTSSKDPATTGSPVSFTATVKGGGNPVTTGSVTFLDNGNPPTGGDNVIALNSAGQAVFTTSQLTEGDHKITASYGGTSGFDESESYVWQRIDDATTVSVASGVYSYCNPGAVLLPTPPANTGAYTPNPSNIFVTDLPGTVNTVSLTLDNFYTFSDSIFELESLVSGPSGDLDFFTFAGASNTVVSSGNYIFEDGQTAVPQSNFGPGAYGPASYNTVADSFFSSASLNPSTSSPFYSAPATIKYAAPHGSSTFTNVFGDTNGNGTWSLFFNQTNFSSPSGAQNGWCLNFKENAPVVTATLPDTQTFTQGQQGASFTVDVDNTGPGSTGDPTSGSNPMTVTDTLNAAFTFASGSGSGWTCSAIGQTVTCTDDSAVADGSEYPELTINVNVSDTASGTIGNTVTAAGAGAASVASNTDSVNIQPAPVLSLTKSHTGNFTQGQTAVWDIVVSNGSSSGSTSGTTTVSDTLPTGYTLSGYTGTGWTCSAVSNAVTCTSSQAVTGGSPFPTIALTVSVPANSPTAVSNIASAWGGGDLVHTSSGTAATSNTDTAAVNQVPASVTVTGGGSQSTPINTAFTTPLTVLVEDAAEVAIPNQSVTFTAPPSGASGTFTNGTNTITATTSSAAGTLGQLSEAFTANGTAGGPYNVTVTAGSASANPTFSLTNNAPALVATSVVVSGYPSPDYVGVAHTATVTVDDQNGNPLTTYSGSATITSSDSAATLPTSPVTVTNGTATFSVTFNTPGTSQSITATIPGPISGSQTGIVVNASPTFVVTTATDDASGNAANCPGSDCSLRDAMTAAINAGEGTITFDPTVFATPQTILLGNPLPNVNTPMTISGPGSALVAISGANISSILEEPILDVGLDSTLVISGVTFTQSNAGTNDGGAITNNGTLTLVNDTFSNNSAAIGGAVHNAHSLTVRGCTFFSNQASDTGGAIQGTGPIVIEYSTFTGNTANAGAAIETASGGLGGALTIANSTISGNTAAVSYGGISSSSSSMTINNSIVSGDTGPDGEIFGSYTGSGNLIGTATGLSALGNFGGPTQTILPLPGSNAICGGVVANIPSGFTTDQRGDPNTNSSYTNYTSGTACVDVGAVQTNYALSFTAEPPSTGTVPGTAMSPAPQVTVTESGVILTAGSASLMLEDTSADLTTLPTTASTVSGVATFSSLIFTNSASSDKLLATLPLDPTATPAPAISTLSDPFSVGMLTPTLSFVPSPNSQTYGTAIAAGSLDATASYNNTTVAGTFTYTTLVGGVQTTLVAGTTILPVGSYTITASFAPSSSNYGATSTTAGYQVTAAGVTLGFVPNPNSQTYGTAITAGSLDATATYNNTAVAGTFTYTTLVAGVQTTLVAGTTILPVGSYTITASFAPSSTNYSSGSTTAGYSVTSPAPTPTISFDPNPDSQSYGTPIESGSLDATAKYDGKKVAGTFAYTTLVSGVQTTLVAGTTILPAGRYTITAAFTPSSSSYSPASATASYTVTADSVTLGFAPNPKTQTYGTPIAAGSLDATATYNGSPAPGTFTYTTLVSGVTTTLTAGTTVLPIGTYTITASFTPSSTNYSGGSITAGYSVTSATSAPVAKISPTSINFGTLYLGSIVTQEVTITNTGNAAMNISNPLIAVVSGGDSSEFITVNHCPRSLAAGNSCVMTVTFIAGPFYNPQTATLTINDNAASSPQTVMLYATVIDPVAQLSAGNLSFGTVKVGKSSASQSVTLSNPGGTALTGITIGVGGADPGDFLATSNCGSSLASKKSCTISVTFKPTAKKSRTASVTISDNAQNSPQSISVAGTGN